MTYDVDTAGRSRYSPAALDQTDRVLVAGCIALWLAALGAGVAALVALVALGRGRAVTSGAAETPWLLYSVIGVSAAVIAGAIPLLVRARRASSTPEILTRNSLSGGAVDGTAAPKLEPFGAPVIRRLPIPPATSRVAFPAAKVDQVWLRCTAITVGAIGAAMTVIGIATYLMASRHDTASWTAYGVAGVITLALPIVPWFFLRQLTHVLDSSEPITA